MKIESIRNRIRILFKVIAPGLLDRVDYADFGCHNSIRLETEHFLNTLALTVISFSGRFVFAQQKHLFFFFASDPLVNFGTLNMRLWHT